MAVGQSPLALLDWPARAFFAWAPRLVAARQRADLALASTVWAPADAQAALDRENAPDVATEKEAALKRAGEILDLAEKSARIKRRKAERARHG